MDSFDNNESSIERHHRIGQTSEQLADRNAVWRVLLYSALGGITFGIVGNFALPSFVIGVVFVGIVVGMAVAILIEQKMKREDLANASRFRSELAMEKERETLALIEAAKANGDFDRWKKDE